MGAIPRTSGVDVDPSRSSPDDSGDIVHHYASHGGARGFGELSGVEKAKAEQAT